MASNPNEEKPTYDATEYNRHLMNNVIRTPLVVSTAQGEVINTPQGPLLDFWGDEGVCSLGYNTPEFTQALLGFMATGAPHQLPDVYPHEFRWQAAEMLCTRTEMDKVFFACTGTEANEGAIKLARKFWWDREGSPMRSDVLASRAKRHVILTVEGNFHGRTANSSAAGDFRVSPYHRWGFGPTPMGFGVLSASADAHGNVHFEQVVTNGVEHVPKEPDWETVAGVIMAPVLGNNVVHTYGREFWVALEKLRKETGVLVIYDDVQAGNGRAGYNATWQHPLCRVKPDIMTLAKGMAMGFPMSALLASADVAKAFTPGVHFNTFAGSPLISWMAVKYIEWLDANLAEVREKGARIRAKFSAREWIKHHDGWGMLNAFTPDFERHGYDGFDFVTEARRHGLSLCTHRQFGPIRFTPPMNVSEDVLRKAFEALDRTDNALRVKKLSV